MFEARYEYRLLERLYPITVRNPYSGARYHYSLILPLSRHCGYATIWLFSYYYLYSTCEVTLCYVLLRYVTVTSLNYVILHYVGYVTLRYADCGGGILTSAHKSYFYRGYCQMCTKNLAPCWNKCPSEDEKGIPLCLCWNQNGTTNMGLTRTILIVRAYEALSLAALGYDIIGTLVPVNATWVFTHY